MSTGHQLLTSREFEQLTFERPTELVRGEIVEYEMPGGRHGLVCAAVLILLGIWNRQTNWGTILANDSYVRTEQTPDSVRGPDCQLYRQERLSAVDVPQGTIEIPPDLVVEVVSPSDRLADVARKVAEYHRAGVQEVWVVDWLRRKITAHPLDEPPDTYLETDRFERPDLLPGFACSVIEMFGEK